MMMFVSFTVVALFFVKKSLWWYLEILFYVLSFYFLWVVLNYYSMIDIKSDWVFLDYVSMLLVLLSFFIAGLMLSASYSSVLFTGKNEILFSFLCFFMVLFLYYTFFSSNVINFYIFFESSLLPIFLMVMGWGYQPERLQASLYMLLYTLFASLPLLMVILMESEEFSSFIMSYKNYEGFSGNMIIQSAVTFFFVFAFLVKLPMFLVHLWLPKAHVEAPVAGSMILAGVLLKLGGYGVWRVLQHTYPVFPYGILLLIFGMVGGVIVSFTCAVQVDMKALVAFSSVVHMGIMLSGLATLGLLGFEGALCMMLGHGVVSSGLFYLVGVNYDRVGSRSLLVNKGMMVIFPSLTMVWFVLSIFNISAPPSLSLLSEIFLASSILASSVSTVFFLMAMNFMSMVYTFYLYAQSQQGKSFEGVFSSLGISAREYTVSYAHAILVGAMVSFFWLF